MQAQEHSSRPRILFGMDEEGGEPIYVQARGFRMRRLPRYSPSIPFIPYPWHFPRNRTYKDVVSWRARTPTANRINGRWCGQHKGARHTGGYPLSTPSTGSTLSTMVAPAPAADADPVLAPKLKLLGTTLVQCWARRDNDQHLDRRLSSTRLCPTYTCPGQPLVSTEVIIREPWGYTMIRNTRYDNL